AGRLRRGLLRRRPIATAPGNRTAAHPKSSQETGMKRITIFSLIAVVFFSLVAGDRRSVAQSPRPGLPTARPEDVGMSSERLGRIRTGVQRYVDSGMAPGVGTLAARRRRGLYVQDVRVPHGDSQTALSHDAH